MIIKVCVPDYDTLKQISNHGFSMEASKKLFDFYDQLSEDLGEPIEFRPKDWSMVWSEETLPQLLFDYAYLLTDYSTEEIYEIASSGLGLDHKVYDQLVTELGKRTTLYKLSRTYLIYTDF